MWVGGGSRVSRDWSGGGEGSQMFGYRYDGEASCAKCIFFQRG